MVDPLTGLYNRRGFQNRLENLFALGSERNVVVVLDIDHFKAYNDHYGHMMGDQALARVSAAIRDAVRSRDIVARFGGEEFLVLLTNTDLEMARKPQSGYASGYLICASPTVLTPRSPPT